MYRRLQLCASCMVLIAVIVGGCSGHSRPGNGASSATPTGPNGSRTLAATPSNCPGPKPHPKQVTQSVGRVFGRKPVWAGPYGMLDPKSGALQLVAAPPYTRYGWRDKVLWLVASHYTGVIRLRGHSLSSGRPLRFSVELSGEGIKTYGLLNHGRPGAVSNPGEPKQFPSYIYFPKAGCYAISASWRHGRWKVVLGLGH